MHDANQRFVPLRDVLEKQEPCWIRYQLSF